MKHPQPIQLTIPNPCHEDWAQMTPDERGRFCNRCQKSVVNFTGWSDGQIHQYITAHAGERICGILTKSQIQKPLYSIIPISRKPVAMQWLAAGLALMLTVAGADVKAMVPHSIQIVCIAEDEAEGRMDKDKPVRISGFVRSNSEKPLANAAICVAAHREVIAETTSDSNGYFEIMLEDFSENDSLMLKISADDFKTRMDRITNAAIDRTIVVHMEALLRGDIFVEPINYGRKPLIDAFEPNKQIITSEEIEKMAR